MELAKALTAMGVYAILNGLGRLFFGWFNDKFGVKPAMILDCLIMGGGLLGMVFLFKALGYPGLLISVGLVGVGYSGAVPLAALLANSNFGPKHFPTNYGMFTIPGAIFGGLLGPFIGGYIKTTTGSYTTAILTAASLSALGILVTILLRQPPRRTDD